MDEGKTSNLNFVANQIIDSCIYFLYNVFIQDNFHFGIG